MATGVDQQEFELVWGFVLMVNTRIARSEAG
jgi:hypothetical protein